MKSIFDKIDRKAEAGLNQATFGGAREFLIGIRRDCAEAVFDAAIAIQALRLIRHASGNTTEWATWAQRMAAWGMEPNKWPKPDDSAPIQADPDATAKASFYDAALGIPFEESKPSSRINFAGIMRAAHDALTANKCARLALSATMEGMDNRKRDADVNPPPASGQVTHTGHDGYQRVTQRADWMECERISNIPAVHEAILAFAEDKTGDNAIGIIYAAIEAHQQKR